MVVELQYVKLDSTYISSCNPIIPFYLDQSELPPSSLSFYRSPSYGSHVLRMSDKVILPCRSIEWKQLTGSSLELAQARISTLAYSIPDASLPSSHFTSAQSSPFAPRRAPHLKNV